jgi:hypothetical protein
MHPSRTAALFGVAALTVVSLVGCSRGTETEASARVGYCPGIDAEHPPGSQAQIEFKRDAVVLGSISVPVTGTGSLPVTPGDVQVFVDGEQVATMMTTPGTTVYAKLGTGCPDSLTP